MRIGKASSVYWVNGLFWDMMDGLDPVDNVFTIPAGWYIEAVIIGLEEHIHLHTTILKILDFIYTAKGTKNGDGHILRCF